MLGLLPDEDGDAQFLEPLRVIAFRPIGALHLITQIMQHLRDAAHADATDADEMQYADIERELVGEGRALRFILPCHLFLLMKKSAGWPIGWECGKPH